MKTELQTSETKINHLLRNMSLAFGVSSCFFDLSGCQLGCCGFEGRSNLCCFIHNYDATQICRQSYLQGFYEAMEHGEAFIYFCPFGLVNVTFPLLCQNRDPYFVTTGPLLYRTPDDQMISNILDLNFLLRPRAREIRQYLSEIPVMSETQVHSMVDVIANALKGTTLLLSAEAKPKEELPAVFQTELRLWLDANPYQNDTRAFQRRLAEILPDGVRLKNFHKNDLQRLIDALEDFIFKASSPERMIHRSLKYIEFLMDFSKEKGLPLEDIFNTRAIDIEKIKTPKNTEELKAYIRAVNGIFLNHYDARSEVHNKSVIFRAMHYIRTHYDDISLSAVADYVALNPTYFSNLFKKSTGQSYSGYLNRIRIEESKRLLLENHTLSDIAQRVGFSDQSYFTNVFKKSEGISPNRWKQEQEKGEVIF